MKTEDIIERLRNPQKYNQASNAQQNTAQTSGLQKNKNSGKQTSWFAMGLALFIFIAVAITWGFVLREKKRAENITAALDPKQIQGLKYETDFNPNKGVTYVQINEGLDRNVAVDTLGTTLPIVSRYNYQALTPANYSVIGMAPWALTENFAANVKDPAIIQYLLNRPEVGEAFIGRDDVAPLLEDPQLLAAFVQDNQMLQDFFSGKPIQQLLANEQMVRVIGASRFMSYLLTSKAVKYYRDHPQEAVRLINASPALNALRRNPGVRQAVSENRYLKPIATQLLGNTTHTRAKK